MKRFLLIDDHSIVRSGISFLLSQVYSQCEIDEAENGEIAVQQIKTHQYDFILMDIQIPGTNTLDLLDYILTVKPQSKVLMFSMNSEAVYAKRYLKAGAKGFLSKDAPVEEIKKAINLVLNNKKYYSEAMLESLIEDDSSRQNENPFEKLSEREFAITNLLLKGMTLTEVSAALNIQMSTTGTHKARIFEKLNVKNILQLSKLAKLYQINS